MTANTSLTNKEMRRLQALLLAVLTLAPKRSPKSVRYLMLELQDFKDTKSPKPRFKIWWKQRIPVDRMTPLEVQIKLLQTEGKIHGDLRTELTSKNYPSDMTRPSEITLAVCLVSRAKDYKDDEEDEAMAAILRGKGVIRCGDPYELCAWVRHKRKGHEDESDDTVALDQCWKSADGYRFVPFVQGRFDRELRNFTTARLPRSVTGERARFLVVCED